MPDKKALTPKTIAIVLSAFLCVIAVILFVYSESKAKSASSELEYYFITKISDSEKRAVEPSKDGSYALKANQSYKVSLTADGTVNNGYCKILSNASDNVLTTQQIANESTISFTLIPEKDASYTFVPVAGTNVLSADVTDRGTIGTLQKQEVKIAEKATTDTPAASIEESVSAGSDWSVEDSSWDYDNSDDYAYFDSGSWWSSSSSSSSEGSASTTPGTTPTQSTPEPSTGNEATPSAPDNTVSEGSDSQENESSENESSSGSEESLGEETGGLTEIQ